MERSRSSKTAEQMALSRAIETRRSLSERVCNDPWAEKFLGGRYRWLLLGRPLRDAVEKQIERLFPGHHYYVVARTRYFDDCLLELLAQGPEQIVILGAGYDSRPYRFADALRSTRVFEVDHPATSAAKQARVHGILGHAPAHVTFVPVDFNVETLPAKLEQAGYDAGRRTLFLWEGVTPYLRADAVKEVLGLVAASGSGSAVVFDYVLASVIDGGCTLPHALEEFNKMAQTAEPFTFGIAEGGSSAFLASLGFRDVVDVGAAELKQRYFAHRPARLQVKPWWRIARAVVA